MKEIISILKKEDFLDFFDYFERQKTLGESLVSFFSLLELIKSRIVMAIQESVFHPIKVWLREEPSLRRS